MGKKTWLVLALVIVGGYFLLFNNSPTGNGIANVNAIEATLYKSPSCGCCGLFIGGLERSGYDVNVQNMQDTNPIKNKYNIPANLASCHTTVVGDYFVEGHVPYEAITKLLEEKPDIAGIALPGMPSGSPGMPGPKRGDFVIYSINHDGTSQEYMRV